MASFIQDSVVKYACSCGILNPISKLFFCRHCPALRCGSCVCHEVDSHFCSNCLENIPSSEVRHKKNCCANCFNCPCCQHTLSARAKTVIVPRKTEDASKESEDASKEKESFKPDSTKVVTKKMYYLSCLSCRWTSRDVGIPDQVVASGAWPDNECTHQSRFNALSEYYQAVVQQDKQERQEYLRRKMPKAHKFPSLTDRTGLTVSIIRRQMGWADKNTQKAKPVNISASQASEDVELLPDDIFTKNIDLRNITTISQRHNQPAEQPFNINKLYPQRRCMWIKRSLRCRQCEHNVIKPEYHPSSVKYRIQLFANYHVPDILLIQCPEPLQPGQLANVILQFSNPTLYDMTITIVDLPTREQQMELIEEFKKSCTIKNSAFMPTNAMDSLKTIAAVTGGTNILSGPSSLTNASLMRQTCVYEEPRLVDQIVNCKMLPLESSFIVHLRDESKDYDEEAKTPVEEPKFIIWRHANKVRLQLQFMPDSDLKVGDNVYLGFQVLYTYVNTVTNTPEKKEPTTHNLNCRVYIKVGQIKVRSK